jgi:hypothetical protein
VSAVKRLEYVNDRMSYIVLGGRWCHIIVLNEHAPSEKKSDDPKDSIYEELEQVFDHSPEYHIKILLGDLNAKVWREDIFKPISMQKWGERIFSSRLSGKRVYIRIVMIMVLE